MGEDGRQPTYSLFGYPAYDNYAGVMYPLSWVKEVQARSNDTHVWKVGTRRCMPCPSAPSRPLARSTSSLLACAVLPAWLAMRRARALTCALKVPPCAYSTILEAAPDHSSILLERAWSIQLSLAGWHALAACATTVLPTVLQVLLDAAAFVPTHKLNLTETPADFVDLSFYKLFGYPTGIGALILRTENTRLLRKVSWEMHQRARWLGAAGSCWELLGAAGSCWELLGAAGSCWELLGASHENNDWACEPLTCTSSCPSVAHLNNKAPRLPFIVSCAQLYWGGGSVFLATAALDWHYFREAPHSYEHGTLPFLDIIAVRHGEPNRIASLLSGESQG